MVRIDLLKKGDILPILRLPEISGEDVRLDGFRNRCNLVLFLTHPVGCAACEEKLRELNDALELLRSEEAEVLAVVPGHCEQAVELQRRLALAFPVLSDAGAALNGKAVLAVADRFGEIFAITGTDEEHRLPTVAMIAEELAFVALQCPE
jgi:peroxiredoxin